MVLHKQSTPYMASSTAWQLSNFPHKHTKAWYQKMYLCYQPDSNNPNFLYNLVYQYQIYYSILFILFFNSTQLKPSLFILGDFKCQKDIIRYIRPCKLGNICILFIFVRLFSIKLSILIFSMMFGSGIDELRKILILLTPMLRLVEF